MREFSFARMRGVIMYRTRIEPNVFIELQDYPKGLVLPCNYIKKFITFFNDDTGQTKTLSFICNEKLFNYLDNLGYAAKLYRNYSNWRILYNTQLPFEPMERLPMLSLVILLSIS